ncbi:phage baseplate upper protein [Bacillus atrophaeus]|uniref:phage baseplate upper protein n=1 Tax=Bacillus atrophaeus TaxID=1452 RepID=UPI002E1E448E|nr:phage baseplate upper protein [Bacillus atrophaeus]
MIYNDAQQSFEVTSRTKTNIKTGIQFSTQDIGTARLIFTLTKDGVRLPLSAVTGKLVMFMADGSRFIRNVEITDKVEGIAQYVLTSDEIRHYGEVNAELNLYYANSQSLSVHKFSFTIDKALIDTDIVPVAEYYIDDFEALRDKINELYDEAIQTIEELRKKFEDLENIETKEGAQAKADAAERNAKAYTDEHTSKTDNPHAVTKAQVGLGNVDNVKQETPAGAQSKADKALADGKAYADVHAARTDNPHSVTKEQIGLSNVENVKQATYSDFNAHNLNSIRHITADERTAWNAKETMAGAQAKVDAHANKTDIHVEQADKDKWNAPWTVVWNNVTLINGAQQNTSYPFKFSVVNNKIELRGTFGSLPAAGTSVAKFTYKPTQLVDFVVPTIGSYGTARFAFTTDGDLRFDGLSATDSASVTRVSFNIGIPLW